MPIDIEDRHNGIGVIYNCRGVVTVDDFFQAGNTFLAAPEDIKKWRYCIVDLTSGETMQLEYKDVTSIVQQNKHIAVFAVPGVLLAIASPKNLGYGIGRMWEVLVEQVGWETRTFHSRPEAELWIKQRTRQKFGIELSDAASNSG